MQVILKPYENAKINKLDGNLSQKYFFFKKPNLYGLVNMKIELIKQDNRNSHNFH